MPRKTSDRSSIRHYDAGSMRRIQKEFNFLIFLLSSFYLIRFHSAAIFRTFTVSSKRLFYIFCSAKMKSLKEVSYDEFSKAKLVFSTFRCLCVSSSRLRISQKPKNVLIQNFFEQLFEKATKLNSANHDRYVSTCRF